MLLCQHCRSDCPQGSGAPFSAGRFPVTLYKEQWTKLLDMAEDIRAFIQANDAHLKTKS